MKKLIALTCMVVASFGLLADEFHWQGNPTSWQSWSDGTLWKLSDGTAAGRAPDGASDFLWPYPSDSGTVIGRLDLDGASRTIGGYSATTFAAAWKSYELQLTNGTLTILNAVSPRASAGDRAICYTLWNGATLNYGGPTSGTAAARIGGNGLCEKWTIKSGATMVANDYLNFWYAQISVAAGGALTLGGSFRLCNGCAANKPITVVNNGTLNLPNGLDWTSGDGYSSTDLAKVFTLTQAGGEVRFGGDFKKTGEEIDPHPAKMSFVFSGGKLVTEEGKSVAFRNVTTKRGTETFAEVSAGAAVTVETLEDSMLDMGLFTYGAGASLTKTGAGLLKLREMPSSLAVNGGEVSFAATNVSLANVTFADGTKMVLNAPGAVLPDLANVDAVDFALGDDFPSSGVIVTGCDPAVAAKIAAKIVVPERLSGSTAVAEGGTVYLKLPLTVVACSFSVPTGTPAAGCGFRTVGLQDGDRQEAVVTGTPVYAFGEYTTGSAAGTYQVTVSGLSSTKYAITYEPGTIWAFDEPQTPTVFYWAATGNVRAEYTDLANWKMDKALTEAATRLPCAADRIYGYGPEISGTCYIGTMDLNHGDYTLGGYSAGSAAGADWKNYWLNVANGTLTIQNTLRPKYEIAYSHEVKNGTLNLYMPLSADSNRRHVFGTSGLASQFRIGDGGVINVYNRPEFLAFAATISAGGRLKFDSGTYYINNAAIVTKGNTISNEGGTLELPNGWDCAGDAWSDKTDFAKTFKVYQRGGETRLGGDFKKTGKDADAGRRGVYFSFEGGKLVAETGRIVRFVQSLGAVSPLPELFATVADNAAVTAEPLEGATLDMSEFTYGEGSSMTKIGTGTLVLAATLPPTLAVESGALELTVARTDLAGVTFADGAKFVFGAKDNVFDAIDNAANVTFALDPEKIVKKDVLMTSSDPALLETVRDNFVLPAELVEKYEVAIDGTALKFQRKPIGMMLLVR